LPRPAQLHPIQPHLNAIPSGVIGSRAISREQRQLGRLLRSLVEGLDDPAPCLALTVVDLPQVQHLPLHHLATGTSFALNDVPVAMLLAVLDSTIAAQIHGADSTQNRIAEKGC
jgi:hypothetical protein